MRKNKTNIWKLKHDREERRRGGRGGRGGGTEEGEAISENKRAFKSKGWKLVRLLFLKNDPCVVLLLRARYILFYLPEEAQQGVLAQKNSAMVSFAHFVILDVNLDRGILNHFTSLTIVSLISSVGCPAKYLNAEISAAFAVRCKRKLETSFTQTQSLSGMEVCCCVKR